MQILPINSENSMNSAKSAGKWGYILLKKGKTSKTLCGEIKKNVEHSDTKLGRKISLAPRKKMIDKKELLFKMFTTRQNTNKVAIIQFLSFQNMFIHYNLPTDCI